MDAVISDCDGVIADSEPIHYAGFRDILAAQGVALTEQAYYERYLGFDDHDCLLAAGRDNGRDFTEDEIAEMTAGKTKIVQAEMHQSLKPMPGVAALFAALAEIGVPLGVCSGGLRTEVELATAGAGIGPMLEVLVCAEDVQAGKPDPEGYRLALQRLGERTGKDLDAARTVVLEDAPAGIEAASTFIPRALAVTTSYTADALAQADRVVASLDMVSPEDLVQLL